MSEVEVKDGEYFEGMPWKLIVPYESDSMGYHQLWCSHESGFYFRVAGYGLAVERDMPVLFSERYGHRRVLRFGHWAVQWLRRSQMLTG